MTPEEELHADYERVRDIMKLKSLLQVAFDNAKISYKFGKDAKACFEKMMKNLDGYSVKAMNIYSEKYVQVNCKATQGQDERRWK